MNIDFTSPNHDRFHSLPLYIQLPVELDWDSSQGGNYISDQSATVCTKQNIKVKEKEGRRRGEIKGEKKRERRERGEGEGAKSSQQ